MATKNEEILRKPDWLKIKLNTNENYTGLKKMMREKNLNTVCEEAKCPNIHECLIDDEIKMRWKINANKNGGFAKN